MKTIAIVGKPNVGKSSLFNRLAKSRIAITSNIAGTTRDTNATQILVSDKPVRLVDTGGIEETRDELFSQVAQKAKLAAKEADLILYVVDGREIPTLEDKKLFFSLQKSTPSLLVINKIDNDAHKEYAYNFAEFGTQDMYFISVTHNRGISILLNAIDNALFDTTRYESSESSEEELLSLLEQSKLDSTQAESNPTKSNSTKSNSAKKAQNAREPHEQSDTQNADSVDSSTQAIVQIGIIGRVNVGKSSLLNALVGRDRSVVSAQAGTTIDPVDEEICFEGTTLRFVDTAGIRRKGKIQSLEKYALDRTSKVLEQSDIAILVLDSSAPLVELDEKIFSLVQKHALGVIIVWNKWDIRHAEFEHIKAEFMRKFRFVEYAPFLTLSALKHRHITELKHTILEVYSNYASRIPTAKLNESIQKAVKLHPIPSDHGKLVRIYYATQYAIKPPQIALISNRPTALHFSYKRFLINQLRKEFGLRGTPILLAPRPKGHTFSDGSDGADSTRTSDTKLAESKRSTRHKKRTTKIQKSSTSRTAKRTPQRTR